MIVNETQVSRVTRSKEQAERTYDKLSRWYDWIAGSEKKYVNAGLELLAAKRGEKVLEIGCGTGYAIVELARAVGELGMVYGVDLSRGMLERARTRVGKMGLSRRVVLLHGDAAQPKFNPGFLDAIFMSFTLELFDTPEIPIVLRECRRVLCHGGRIGVVAMSKQARPSWTMRLYEWAHRTFPALVDCRPIFVQRTLDEAGFHITDVTQVTLWGLPGEIVVAIKE